MKKNAIILSLMFSATIFAQVTIGGETTTNNNSVSLEFASGAKGIILPYVEDSSSITEPGTIYLDVAAGDRIRIKTATGFFDYNSEDANDTRHNGGNVDLVTQSGLTEATNAKTIIGSLTSTVDGVLILEDKNKGMVLPKLVAPQQYVINPSAGMMVYDPFSKLLCIFNGVKWSFWSGN